LHQLLSTRIAGVCSWAATAADRSAAVVAKQMAAVVVAAHYMVEHNSTPYSCAANHIPYLSAAIPAIPLLATPAFVDSSLPLG
jgi:hypothetical protein